MEGRGKEEMDSLKDVNVKLCNSELQQLQLPACNTYVLVLVLTRMERMMEGEKGTEHYINGQQSDTQCYGRKKVETGRKRSLRN